MGIEVGEFLPAKPFETCNSSAAELYWRPDSVFLCMNSDADIHHRLRLCDVCEQAPATVSCEADSAALCFTCDGDIHSANPLANRHDRRPVSPFFYDTADAGNFRFCYETLDEFIDFTNPNGVFAAQSLNPSVSSTCLNSRVVSDESSISSENGGSGKAATADREARVQRYREKKKNRRFKKMIRYASRKAYAESRPRIKGRFVKHRMIAGNRSSEEFLDLTDAAGGYRVVPSF